jgi:hypothetical protein
MVLALTRMRHLVVGISRLMCVNASSCDTMDLVFGNDTSSKKIV